MFQKMEIDRFKIGQLSNLLGELGQLVVREMKNLQSGYEYGERGFEREKKKRRR